MNFEEQLERGAPVDTVAIILRVCEHFECTLSEICGYDKRDKRICMARQVAAWSLRQAGLSMEAVGRALKRDHTSVSRSVRIVEHKRIVSPRVAKVLERLKGAA